MVAIWTFSSFSLALMASWVSKVSLPQMKPASSMMILSLLMLINTGLGALPWMIRAS